jgi:peptidoglycan/LPS O-acetylase OafA/YrhL
MIVIGSDAQNADAPMFADEGAITWQGVVYRLASARPDMIVYGCLLAFVNRAIPRPLTDELRRWIAIGGWIGWALFFTFLALGNRVPGFELFGGPVYQLALLFLAPIVLDLYLRQEGLPARILANRHLKWLGVRSYGIYLWHVPVLLLFIPMMQGVYGPRRLLIGLVASAAGVLMGVASYRFVERPFLRMKESRYRRPQDEREPSSGVAS